MSAHGHRRSRGKGLVAGRVANTVARFPHMAVAYPTCGWLSPAVVNLAKESLIAALAAAYVLCLRSCHTCSRRK